VNVLVAKGFFLSPIGPSIQGVAVFGKNYALFEKKEALF
jgi:hypothetical protein